MCDSAMTGPALRAGDTEGVSHGKYLDLFAFSSAGLRWERPRAAGPSRSAAASGSFGEGQNSSVG